MFPVLRQQVDETRERRQFCCNHFQGRENERDIFQIAPNCRFWQKNPKTRQFQPYSTRPKPWNKNALKATFSTVEFQQQDANYKVHFLYDVENTTDRNYDFASTNFTLLAVLAEGNSLSKEFGHYQAEDPRLDGPAFIPTHGKARIHVVVAYEYPSEWTEKEKSDPKKISESLNRRLRELTGFVAYDQINHYEINMPEGWRNWDDVKKKKD